MHRARFLAPSLLLLLILLPAASLRGETVFIEAESFAEPGGWKLDTQFIDTMGSPYLLAHGLGRPVEDATTTVEFSAAGKYRVWVRTKDWVARWQAKGQPGRFQLLVGGKPLETTFGTEGAEWHWQAGGTVDVPQGKVSLALHDLTGFDGRCDAILFSTDADFEPSNDSAPLAPWRQKLLGLPAEPETLGPYDLVVVGGGYSGMGAALSAARMGCKVALVQNRGVLGGNGSSEVRVWAMGLIRRGRYPRIGEIVEEFADNATKSPGTYEEFGDALKEKLVRAEPNIDLRLHHHAYEVAKDDKGITSVTALDTRSGSRRRFTGRLFVDCTGHATIGALAGADHEMTPKGRMGMSNMWAWAEEKTPQSYPETPWALDLEMKDFPYPRDHHGQWFWESGFNKDPLGDAEGIRDWNLRAVFGAFNAMKNRDGADKHKSAILTWVAFIGGPRESRRLLGDVILTQEDVVSKRDFPDGCVPSTWSIDLHYPKQQYAARYPDNPFIAVAKHDRRVDRNYGYPVPYRCFYSRNIPNLFMAGRCISVTHEALGTVRVMKTCGMMGEVVGKAASICMLHDCLPRDVYGSHLAELDKLLQLPGRARRTTVTSAIVVEGDDPPEHFKGIAPHKLEGLVVDNTSARLSGHWSTSGLKPFVGNGYHYASEEGASARYEFKVPRTGRYEVRVSYSPHKNRGRTVPVAIECMGGTKRVVIDQQAKPTLAEAFVSLGTYDFAASQRSAVILSTKGAGGTVVADAVQLLPAK